MTLSVDRACRTHKRVGAYQVCLCWMNPLRACRTHERAVKCEFSLGTAALCGDRAHWTHEPVVKFAFLLGLDNLLRRSRMSDAQTCGEMRVFLWRGVALSHKIRVEYHKNRCKLQVCNFRNPFAQNESLTAMRCWERQTEMSKYWSA